MDTYLHRRNVWMLLIQIVFVRFIRFSDADCSITTPGVDTFGSECQYMCHCENVVLDADCNITTPGVYTFGSECQYMCHCKNGESCDTTTGECTSGCDQYWFGPGCQYRDLAAQEYSRHGSNLKDSPVQYADRGTDGDISTCSYTREARHSTVRPWWRVILENEVTITDIYILTTTDGLQYFREFEVTVERLPYANRADNTRPSDTSLCYKHDDTIPDSTNIHVTCTTPLIGNQVRISLSEIQSQLIVCDFRINRGRNLAFRQSVTSSTIHQNNVTFFQASNAVNGLVSYTDWTKCFVTGNFSNKWLLVEFDRPTHVYYFNVTTLRNTYDYVDNYKIYDTTSAKELLHDSGSDLSPATHGYLNKNVQKLTIEKTTGDIMAICEFELFGDCPVNQCGYDCSKVCHCNSIKSLEDKISGICTSGCEDRWTGDNGKCDVEWCASNKWGQSCQNECGACRKGPCNFVTGKCTGGCQDGYYNTDDDCKTECVSGWYGDNCQSKCSEHCKNNCDKVNGKCIDGCNSGYRGDKCEQECQAGTYGQECVKTCNENCDVTCHHVSGTCTSCKAGWKGNYCDTECDDGTYGIGCQQTCTGKCLDVCNKVNGVCTSCTAGWTGNYCNEKCPDGTYGQGCIINCNGNCASPCHHVTGTCSSCKAGWNGNYCNTECDDGKFGVGCQQTCTDKCLNVCNKVNGVCSSCTAGWTGNYCNEKCPAGYFGEDCENTCHENCDVTCHHVSGTCTSCKAGRKGASCDTECDDGTYGVGCRNSCTDTCYICDKVHGRLCSSCVPGWTGSTCENKCRAGTYGLNCNNQCNDNCVDICNHVTGKCIQCIEGWTGDYCEQECEDGSYGNRCVNKCTDKCFIPCNKVNGVCTLCQAGLSGLACEYECPDGTYGPNCNGQCNNNCVDICDRVTGKCTQCVDGWKGDFCDQAIEKSTLVAAIAGSSSAIVVIIIVVTIVCIICLRKRSSLKNQPDTELTNRQGNESIPVTENEEAYWTDLQRQDATPTTQNNSQENDNDYDIIQQK